MKRYIGVKEINAKPMKRQAYNDLRGWTLPAMENGDDDGYLVEYVDGGQANTPDFKGYVSWSPNDVFERAYKRTEGLTFGLALEALKRGSKVARKGWNGKGMWLAHIAGWSWHVNPKINKPMAASSLHPAPWIGMKTADEYFVPWLASQTDLLSEDWEIL